MAKLTRKKKVTIVTTALVLVGGATAVAYWTAGGSGTGSAETATGVDALTVVQTSTVSDMGPGVAAQGLDGNFDNPNPETVYVDTVTVTIDSVVKAVGAPAGTCDATDYTLTGGTMTVQADIASGTSVGAWSGATIAFNNKATNQDACKGATVNLAYTAS